MHWRNEANLTIPEIPGYKKTAHMKNQWLLEGSVGQLLGMSLVQKPSLMSFLLREDTRIRGPWLLEKNNHPRPRDFADLMGIDGNSIGFCRSLSLFVMQKSWESYPI